MSAVSPAAVRTAAQQFLGPIMQIPPMVSAVKVGGKRLHQLARAGQEVEREARPVVVHRFDVEETSEAGVVRIEVECSSGTYVRTLAADLGAALGGGAHLRRLRRTAIGSFTAAESRLIGALGENLVLSPAAALRDYAAVTVPAEVAVDVAHGKVMDDARLSISGDGPWPVLDEDGRLLAVYERHGEGRAKPAVVMGSGQAIDP